MVLEKANRGHMFSVLEQQCYFCSVILKPCEDVGVQVAHLKALHRFTFQRRSHRGPPSVPS